MGRKWKLVLKDADRQQHGKFSLGYEKNVLITMIALVFVILKHSLQWRGEFRLYFGPAPEFLLVNSAARRFSMAASFEKKFLSSFLYWCFHWPYLVVQVYELITSVRRANENAGNLISVVQFLINIYIYIAAMIHRVNDPPSTTETLISMKNAMDHLLHLFNFNITSIYSCTIVRTELVS